MKSSASPDPVAAHARELCLRYGLDEGQRDQLLAILDRLARSATAPTTVREPWRAINTHVADALVALELERVASSLTMADLGAGAGFPGLPLAVALPRSTLYLVESQRRKCSFIDDVRAAAAIANAQTVCLRAEEWEAGRGAHDVVLARALAPQPVVLEYAAPLLRVGGTLVDWRGRRNADEERRAGLAAHALGMREVEVRRVEPYAQARDHHLHVYAKVAPTPPRFPRRPGIARKRPLGC